MRQAVVNTLRHEMLAAISNGTLDGYRPQAPKGEGAEVDREVCRLAECWHCGAVGLEYRPFSRGYGEYRAFSICRECGNEREI